MRTLLAVAALVTGMGAYAQEESTTKAKQQDVIQKEMRQNAPGTEDIDNEITNARMRAESGSKSKHSMSIEGGYSGGNLSDAFGRTRPQLAPGEVVAVETSASAGISYRYRITPKDSISLGMGLSWTVPGHEGQQTELSDPGISYSRSFKTANLQNSISIGFGKNTTEEVLERTHLNETISVSHTGLAEIGTSGWQIGLSTIAYTNTYYKYMASPATGQDERLAYSIGFYPFAEYVFNDTFNLRTVYRGNTYYSTRDNNAAFQQLEPTQSLGLGIAATRDIYLYPNIQWVWRDIDTEKTNVALSATMNFF